MQTRLHSDGRPRVLIQAWVEPEFHKHVRYIAIRKGVTAAELIRQAMSKVLADNPIPVGLLDGDI